MAVEDDPEAISGPGAENDIPFEALDEFTGARADDDGTRDDDELVRSANDTIAKWQAASGIPSLTQVQELFYESICAGASAMARDKIVAAIIGRLRYGAGREARAGEHLEPTCSKIASNYHPCRGCRIALIARVNRHSTWGQRWKRKMTPPVPAFRN